MNQRIKEKDTDELIIVRLRCVYIVKCGKCCNKEVMDIAIKENDLILEEHRHHSRIHFKKTLANALERLKINPERLFCDKHKGDNNNETDKNSDCAGIAAVNSNAKNFRHG